MKEMEDASSEAAVQIDILTKEKETYLKQISALSITQGNDICTVPPLVWRGVWLLSLLMPYRSPHVHVL